MRTPRFVIGFALLAIACTGGDREADVLSPALPPPAPSAVVPPAPVPVEEALGPEQPPAGGWIQDEVIYDAEGGVYGCVGGGNWCASSPARDPKTHQARR